MSVILNSFKHFYLLLKHIGFYYETTDTRNILIELRPYIQSYSLHSLVESFRVIIRSRFEIVGIIIFSRGLKV